MAIMDLEEKGLLKKIGQIYLIKTLMPFPLKENNCFLAESEKGWTLIDTGVNLEMNRDIFNMALKEIGINFKNIKKIYLTHYHHDHTGLAGWIQKQNDAEVFLSQNDISIMEKYINSGLYLENIKKTSLEAGWTINLLQDLSNDVAKIDTLIRPMAELSPLYENDKFSFADQEYQCLSLPGHTDGHFVFYSADNSSLFAGDNIISHTILHMSDWPHTSLENPYKIHIEKLKQINQMSINTVFTGHGEYINYNLDEKIEEISKHHEKRKNIVYKSLDKACSAWELSCKMFKINHYIHIKRLLLAETLAYLNTLASEGYVEKDISNDVHMFRKERFYGNICSFV